MYNMALTVTQLKTRAKTKHNVMYKLFAIGKGGRGVGLYSTGRFFFIDCCFYGGFWVRFKMKR